MNTLIRPIEFDADIEALLNACRLHGSDLSESSKVWLFGHAPDVAMAGLRTGKVSVDVAALCLKVIEPLTLPPTTTGSRHRRSNVYVSNSL